MPRPRRLSHRKIGRTETESLGRIRRILCLRLACHKQNPPSEDATGAVYTVFCEGCDPSATIPNLLPKRIRDPFNRTLCVKQSLINIVDDRFRPREGTGIHGTAMALDPKHLDMLARDGSAAGRGRLLSDLSRLILIERDADDVELAIFFDIVRAILASAAPSDRREFAETAADHAAVPHDLVLLLALDEIRVAEPVLIRSLALTDPDLVGIVEQRSSDHHFAIAGRGRLTAEVTETLVRLGTAEVIRRVGANRGATFGDRVLTQLQRRAETDEELFRILIDRTDLPELLVRSMRDTLRRVGEARGSARSAPFGDAHALGAASSAAERPDVMRLFGRVHSDSMSLGEAVIELADADRPADLACLIGLVSEIDESQVLRVLVRADGFGIASVARGLDLGAEVFEHLIGLRRRCLRLSDGEARYESERFAGLDADEARNLVAAAHRARRARA